MSREGTSFQVTISSEHDEKLKQKVMEVLNDCFYMSHYLTNLLETHQNNW